MSYNAEIANRIEAKWQARWADEGTFHADNPVGSLQGDRANQEPYVVADFFPYPSGSGLHVGHPLGYIATDVVARQARMAGKNVLHTIGYDAFGLPAERYAINTGQHPAVTTRDNIANMRRQLTALGLGHDERRSVSTTDPEFYRWTQWIFLQLFNSWYDTDEQRARPIAELIAMFVDRTKSIGIDWLSADGTTQARIIDGYRLAYVAEVDVNWCPELGTVLANEEVRDGKSEQGFDVIKRPLRQWVLRITAYAERLIEDLDMVEWPESVKTMQREWIGQSHGATVAFSGDHGDITVFTTRPDTLKGVTFIAVHAGHPYAHGRDTEGDTGLTVTHPLTGAHIPVYVADYVVGDYGTGALMGVPAHDTRDFNFAQRYELPVVIAVEPTDTWAHEFIIDGTQTAAYTDAPVDTAVADGIVHELEARGHGHRTTTYSLRDWLFSRQRYWGEPFPIVYDNAGIAHAVPEPMLPVTLPEVDDFNPPTDGDEVASPLARADEWINVEMDIGDGVQQYRRETNTMPQWAGSCWYYLRYCDPDNSEAFVDPANEQYWMSGGVGLYVGGAEHAVLHLLYARFWHKVLYDLGHVTNPEPFGCLVNQGYVQAAAYKQNNFYVPADEVVEADGVWTYYGAPVEREWGKMGKSLKNAVAPDDVIAEYGADSLRLYEMFAGPIEKNRPWETTGINGVYRFLRRVAALVADDDGAIVVNDDDMNIDDQRAQATAIIAVTDAIGKMHHNVAIARLMEFESGIRKSRPRAAVETMVQLLSPFAPHLAEELWEMLGHSGGLTYVRWPMADESVLVAATRNIGVQVNGKTRGQIEVAVDADEVTVVTAAREAVDSWVTAEPIKTIVRERIVSFVVPKS